MPACVVTVGPRSLITQNPAATNPPQRSDRNTQADRRYTVAGVVRPAQLKHLDPHVGRFVCVAPIGS